MTLNNFHDSDTQSTMPIIWPVNDLGGILETLSSQNEEDLNSIISMTQFNTNFNSNFTNSTTDATMQYKQQMQILHPGSDCRGCHSRMPELKISSNCLQEQVNQQEIFCDPLLDGGLCSRRFRQYLYHLRNNKHDNGISYWKNFVSEYYAPDSKMRWCFSRYENIELHTAGVFCPKSMVTWCCELCGLKTGKGLEATYEILPRLFKAKSESSMVDEILYLDLPRSFKVSRGVVLEYEKVIQESVFETFRVVHKGKLRIVFGHDLKITSWALCIMNHDEYLQRTVFSPQIIQLGNAVKKYQEFQNPRASLQDFRKVSDTFVSASSKILKHMELPLVNDLGYPKKFIRCLQIGEVLDNMKELMTFSQNTKVGPIESLNIYSQGIQTQNQMNGKQEMELSMATQNRTIFNEAFPVAFDHGKMRDEALFNKLIREMVGSSSRGKSVQEMYAEIVQQSNGACHGDAPTAVVLSQPFPQLLTVKQEPFTTENFQEAFQTSVAGFSSIEDFIGAFSGKKTY